MFFRDFPLKIQAKKQENLPVWSNFPCFLLVFDVFGVRKIRAGRILSVFDDFPEISTLIFLVNFRVPKILPFLFKFVSFFGKFHCFFDGKFACPKFCVLFTHFPEIPTLNILVKFLVKKFALFIYFYYFFYLNFTVFTNFP